MLGSRENITLTDGNIRNSYIRVRQFNDLIPRDMASSTGEILLELEGVGRVKTHIDKKKGILAERKAVKHFFELHGLKSGDKVAVQKVRERHFEVTPGSEEQQVQESAASNQPHDELASEGSGKDQLLLFDPTKRKGPSQKPRYSQNVRRANDLDGKEWTSLSISVWRDIRKTSDELHLDHPAMFPIMLVKRLIRCFTTYSERMILDPFMGSGSTLIGACSLGGTGIGFEIYPDYIELAEQRLSMCAHNKAVSGSYVIYPYDARKLGDYVKPATIDLCFTSPPYWNILTQRRTADYKEIRHYGDSENDLGRISSYTDFLHALGQIFQQVLEALKPGKYCVINVMDLRKGSRFYPFHSDLARELEKVGYTFDDLIIWDRSHEYNNLRPLGYPAVFRINKVHEYLLIFQKPKSEKGGRFEG
jgi:DNA modification methylase